MSIKKEHFMDLLPSYREGLKHLRGSARRTFLGQLAIDIGRGGKALVSKHLGISRVTLRKGIKEVKTGIIQQDRFHDRGRKPLEQTQPELIADIKDIIDKSSQTDPQFKTTRLYTRLSVKQVKVELRKRGYIEQQIPCDQTIWNKMRSLGYKRRKVAKTKPVKKIKETDAIFDRLAIENAQADADPGVLRISHDAKNKVAIGNLSRGGKSWVEQSADDHDFTNEHITPFGLFLPQFKETFLYFTTSRVTADFIVDALQHFLENNLERFSHIHTIVLNGDNGPECHSRRTQFIKRICELSHKYNLVIKLAYYPPYHSKYNPIERVWGGLEQHWNGDILESKETVIKFAENFIWAGKQATVKVLEGIYTTGEKLSAKVMKLYEQAIDRLDETLGKWFVTIQPHKVREILNLG